MVFNTYQIYGVNLLFQTLLNERVMMPAFQTLIHLVHTFGLAVDYIQRYETKCIDIVEWIR